MKHERYIINDAEIALLETRAHYPKQKTLIGTIHSIKKLLPPCAD